MGNETRETAASAAEQVRAALGRVDADEETRFGAWTYLDRRKATDQAAMIDAAAGAGRKAGARCMAFRSG